MNNFDKIFQDNIRIKGRHGDFAQELKSRNFFSSYVELYYIAALVGLNVCRVTEEDTSSQGVNILYEQLGRHRDKIMIAYNLIMLVDNTRGISEEEKINRAVNFYPDMDEEQKKAAKKTNMDLFNSYVRSGIDELYRLLIQKSAEKNMSREDKYLEGIAYFVGSYVLRNVSVGPTETEALINNYDPYIS